MTNKIKLYNKIVIKITFNSSTANHQAILDNTLQAAVLNWNIAKNWGILEKASLQKTAGSLLAAGDWYRFETPSEGIYKIDAPFLQSLGIDITTIDPRTIKIYGYGGYALPEDLSASNNQGMIENAIYVTNEQSGKFGSSDYVLFYGRPPEFWEYNDSLHSVLQQNSRTYDYYARLVHGRNAFTSVTPINRPDTSFLRMKQQFTKKNYYWLTYGGANGKRMSQKTSLSVQNVYQQQSTLAFRSNDKDTVNIGKTGRDYFGDLLFSNSSNSFTYLTTLNGIVPSSTIYYKFRVVNASTPIIDYRIDESGTLIYQAEVAGLSDQVIGVQDVNIATFNKTLTNEKSNLKFTLTNNATNTDFYLDYFEITFYEQLKAVNDYLLLFSKDTTANIEYTLSNFSNSSIQAFDVTNFSNVKIISGASISAGQFKFQAAETSRKLSKYIAVTSAAYKTPANAAKITNSNIRGNLSGSQMIIITSKDFQTQAQRYATYRSSQSPYKLSTSIYYVDDIYNEFSGGLLDPTAIRDFLKFAYEKWQIKPFYVLLFGNGTYDYLNVENSNNNFVPTYQTDESLDEVYSYTTDDFYSRVSGNDLKPDLAVGRLNLRTEADAQNTVDKIIKYENTIEKGLWRNTVTLVADDGPHGSLPDDGSFHTAQSEDLANYFVPAFFDINKIYLVAYPTVYTGLGRRKPGVNQAIIDAMNNGTLIVNWVGHGAPYVWADEDVFDNTTSIPQLHNPDYFFLTAATCNFGEYDRPNDLCGTEILVNMKDAGAIAAFSSARVVYGSFNAAINDSLYTNLFRPSVTDNLPRTLGFAYFLTKQNVVSQENDEKFHLIGDPAIRLDQAHLPSVIDSLNGKTLKSNVQVSALSPVTIKGTVRNPDGSKSSFSGQAIISVFDSKRSQYFAEMNYTVTLPGGLIYRGSVTVNNGEFQTGFVVPKDISYENENGKIVAYFFNNDNDGVGYSTNIIVGGTQNTPNDGKGPDISIYFNDVNSAGSYLVNPNFTLIAKLSDQTGLNTTGTGIGHKLEGIINDDQTSSIDFTNYFVGDVNSGGKSGVIKYNFTNQTPGEYKIKVKAWDVFNNLSTQEARYTVVDNDNGIVLKDVVNYPNPFSSNTTFTFRHNVSNPINLKIKIYTVAGRMIKQIEQYGVLDKFVKIEWDGHDADGNRIANGTYIYKLIVESDDGQFKDNAIGKLSIIK